MTSTPAAIASYFVGIEPGDWFALTLNNDMEIRKAVVVDALQYDPPEHGSRGTLRFTAETTDDERARLDLLSVILHVQAIERRPDEWERAVVSVYGAGTDGTEDERLGKVRTVESVSPPS